MSIYSIARIPPCSRNNPKSEPSVEQAANTDSKALSSSFSPASTSGPSMRQRKLGEAQVGALGSRNRIIDAKGSPIPDFIGRPPSSRKSIASTHSLASFVTAWETPYGIIPQSLPVISEDLSASTLDHENEYINRENLHAQRARTSTEDSDNLDSIAFALNPGMLSLIESSMRARAQARNPTRWYDFLSGAIVFAFAALVCAANMAGASPLIMALIVFSGGVLMKTLNSKLSA